MQRTYGEKKKEPRRCSSAERESLSSLGAASPLSRKGEGEKGIKGIHTHPKEKRKDLDLREGKGNG